MAPAYAHVKIFSTGAGKQDYLGKTVSMLAVTLPRTSL